MTDELSPILEDVTIEIWADEIRHIKIRELADLIDNTRAESLKYDGIKSIRLKTKAKLLEEKLEFLKLCE